MDCTNILNKYGIRNNMTGNPLTFNMSCTSCKNKNPIKKLKNIIEGNKNLLFKNNEVEKIAEARLIECYKCPFKANLIIINGVQYYRCTICQCPIESKTRATNESCPKNKW